MEDRFVAVLNAEAADELDVKTCQVAVAYKTERLITAFDCDVQSSVLTGKDKVLDSDVVGCRIKVGNPVLIQRAVVTEKAVLIALLYELVHFTKKTFLLVVVSDDVACADIARNLLESGKLRVICLVHSVAYGLDKIGCHLAGLQSQNHVGRHGVILELGVRHAGLDQLFVENCSLNPDGKSVEVLDLLEFAGIHCGCENRCAQKKEREKNNQCFLHTHSSSSHLKLRLI